MDSQGGLTRRRGGAAAVAHIDTDIDNGSSSRVTSPGPKPSSTPSYDTHNPETSYASGENGHKIAYDPRDLSETAERSRQPKLTLMEEILLLGLKDKQVRALSLEVLQCCTLLIIQRVTCRSGMTTFHMLYEAAS